MILRRAAEQVIPPDPCRHPALHLQRTIAPHEELKAETTSLHAGHDFSRIPVHAQAPTTAPPIVHEALSSSGQPLNPTTRAFMESRFYHDFSRVRVHTDARAAASAKAVDAQAYT